MSEGVLNKYSVTLRTSIALVRTFFSFSTSCFWQWLSVCNIPTVAQRCICTTSVEPMLYPWHGLLFSLLFSLLELYQQLTKALFLLQHIALKVLHSCAIINFDKHSLLFLAVLESGAPLSSSLEEALYKCSVLMNEWITPKSISPQTLSIPEKPCNGRHKERVGYIVCDLMPLLF